MQPYSAYARHRGAAGAAGGGGRGVRQDRRPRGPAPQRRAVPQPRQRQAGPARGRRRRNRGGQAKYGAPPGLLRRQAARRRAEVDRADRGGGRRSPDCTHVIVHDAARPAVPYLRHRGRSWKPPKSSDAVTLRRPSARRWSEVDEGGNPMAYHLPGQFMNLLTPQAFTETNSWKWPGARREIHPSQVTSDQGLVPQRPRSAAPADAGWSRRCSTCSPSPRSSRRAARLRKHSGKGGVIEESVTGYLLLVTRGRLPIEKPARDNQT